MFNHLRLQRPLASAILASAALFSTASAQSPRDKRDLSKGNTLYVVPYAHLDTQWRWAYPQSIREYIANTLNRNFALIDKYPNYVFNFSGSRRYEMMKEYYPAEYQRLLGYVKAGRWFPCGSSVDENDANIPGAESYVRHILYGNNFFRREFGVASQEYMLPDCFGFPYALPSLLKFCGLKGFSTQKLTWGSAVGIPFKVGTWEGPDGQSIVAALDPGSYGGAVEEDLSQNTSWLARIQNTGKQSGAFVDYHYYGTGDTGGAPRSSSVEWIEKSIAGTGPITVVSSKADDMFKSLTPAQIAKLPHYKGELLLTQHSAGSITSQAYMKRWNRKNELLADGAEKASVAAMWLGGASYPSQRIYNAWDLVLGSQMHDMLPGTSIPKAYEYCWNDELLASNQFAAVETDAVGAVAASMDTRGPGVPLVVYNPLSITRTDIVKARIAGYTEPLKPCQVYGPDGQPVPTQTLGADGTGTDIIFLATVPSTGFATYHVKTTGGSEKSPILHATGRTLENERFRVTINPAGDIASIYDKTAKREALKAPSKLELQYHNPSQFPAWNMDWADAKLAPRETVGGPAEIRVVENGPVRVSIEVTRHLGASTFVQKVSLSKGGTEVLVANTIDWQTRERALKASFPLTSGNPEATYDLQLGTIKRGNNDPKKYEVPQHQWFDLTKPDGSYGVGILNDCKFGSDKPNDDTVRLTLLYTPGIKAGFDDQATQDFGKHEILYSIAPHIGDWRRGGVAWAAKRLNQPLRSFTATAHAGRLGKSFSLVSTNSAQVEVSAIKRSENGNGVIVRLREIFGETAKNVKLTFAGPVNSAHEVNGQEMPIGPATISKGSILTDVGGYSLKAFEVKLGGPSSPTPVTVSQPVALPFNVDVMSTDGDRSDGAFDGQGRSLAGELVPTNLSVDDVTFHFGSSQPGAKNAIAANGQTINLPAGYSKVYVLTASSQGDVVGTFGIGRDAEMARINDWGGYVGQWDNRQWSLNPGPNFTNYGDNMNGLKPAYEKSGEVAWFASHRHTPSGNTFYDYSYLYKVGFDLKGATTFKLPNDPRIKVLAVSVAKNGHDALAPAAPLYDKLDNHVSEAGPSIEVIGGSFKDNVKIQINPPLYYRPGGLRYTLDGSNPSKSSPVYRGPLILSEPTMVKAAELNPDGSVDCTISALKVNVNDVTPPSVVLAASPKALGYVKVQFSEPVTKASGTDAANYKFSSGTAIRQIRMVDPTTAEITLAAALAPGQTELLVVSGVQDVSRKANTLGSQTVTLAERGAVFTAPTLEKATSKSFPVQNLPVKGTDAWTVNLWCEIDTQPEDRTMIAGFGRSTDGRAGTGRYFTKFPEGINFWAADKDLMTNVQLDLGKWQMLTATYDGVTMRVYKNGVVIGEQAVTLENDQSVARAMPLDAWERKRRFGGDISDFTIWDVDLSGEAVKRLWKSGHH